MLFGAVITEQFGLLCKQVYRKVKNQASKQLSGHESNQVLATYMLSGGHLQVSLKVFISIFVNQLNASNL